MADDDSQNAADPMLARLLRHRTRLRPGGAIPDHEVLATYHARSGEQPFAICRHGVLVDPAGQRRFIRFSEIEDTGYHDVEALKRTKAEKDPANATEVMTLRLPDGERIDLVVDFTPDGLSERLTISTFIRQWSVIQRSELRRKSK